MTEVIEIQPTNPEVLKELFDNIPGGFFRYRIDDVDADRVGEFDVVNSEMLEMMGFDTRKEFDDFTGGNYEKIVHPDDLERVVKSIKEQINEGGDDIVQYRLNRLDGKEVIVLDHGHISSDANGQKWLYVSLIDVTDMANARRELERAEERLNLLTAFGNDVIFDVECSSNNMEVFGDFEARFHRKPENKDFMAISKYPHDSDINITQHSLSNIRDKFDSEYFSDYETFMMDDDDNPIWYRYQSILVLDDDGNPVRYVGRMLDTHEQAMRESKFRDLAERDSMTGLFNREAAKSRIDSLLISENGPFSLFLIDVDDFKYVNDNFGHPVGDKVLSSLADYLMKSFRREDIIARLGGDEFLVFASGLGNQESMNRILLQLARGPFVRERKSDAIDPSLEDAHYKPSISVGVVTTNDNDTSFDELYATADELLYEAKKEGKNRVNYREL